ncbi:YheC/YheD family protein [Paenibacillus sp. SI8]|uniref:YheC/YheD family endospore coat-associated protein n=1 Tax=unclassified Paenibacillus TaxID=185978 RepID=UPI0034677E1A
MKTKYSSIGIMVNKGNERKYLLKKYLDCKMKSIKMFCFTPSDVDWERKSIVGYHRVNRRWVMSKFPFPQVVYNRCYTLNPSFIERLEEVIGINKCFNHINQFNKYETYQKLNEWLVHHLPETVPFDKENAARLLNIHKVLYLKPFYGHSGIGVYRVELKNSGEIQFGHNHFLPEHLVGDILQFQVRIQELVGSTPYIIQKGINTPKINDKNFDIRVLVQKNMKGLWSVTNVVSRIAHRGYFNTSICEKVCLSEEVLNYFYPPDMVNAIFQSIYDLSLRSAEIMELHAGYHLGELSVDFALDNVGHVWIIEVNGKPQKDLYGEIREQKNIYKRPLQYAHFLCRHQSIR